MNVVLVEFFFITDIYVENLPIQILLCYNLFVFIINVNEKEKINENRCIIGFKFCIDSRVFFL